MRDEDAKPGTEPPAIRLPHACLLLNHPVINACWLESATSTLKEDHAIQAKASHDDRYAWHVGVEFFCLMAKASAVRSGPIGRNDTASVATQQERLDIRNSL